MLTTADPQRNQRGLSPRFAAFAFGETSGFFWFGLDDRKAGSDFSTRPDSRAPIVPAVLRGCISSAGRVSRPGAPQGKCLPLRLYGPIGGSVCSIQSGLLS